ncbi:MAG: ABC transporter permease, partial [Pseudomonadota bacterium]
MIRFLLRRLVTMAFTLLAISALVFLIINLPPGNYVTNQIAEMQSSGEAAGVEKARALMAEYALDRPLWQQYLIWIGAWPGPNGFSGLLQGDLGWSFELNRPVADVVGEVAGLTVIVNLASLLFVYFVALPLGVIAAVRANTWVDYLASFIGYIGLATPNFLLALIMLFYGAQFFDIPVGGLMAREYEGEPMSLGKALSIAAHLIVPTIVIGTAAAAAVMRRLRANLMDELNKPYVTTARAKGCSAT